MIKWSSLGVMVLVLSQLACGTKPVPRKPVTVRPSLIHPLFFQEEIAAQLNFPFWFNDSIIRSQQIRRLTRTVYSVSGPDASFEEGDENFPKVRTIYTFSPAGRLIFIERTNYSEGIVIAQKNYGIAESAAFAEVIAATSGDPSEERMETYVLLARTSSGKHISRYREAATGMNYLYFPDPKFRGGLSIDSIGHPGSQDWVICGTPEKPEKRYQVRNTVTETNVSNYTYLNGNYPEMISRTDYPFTQKRHFTYSKQGIFRGYIDSTFADEAFVTRIVTSFRLDKLNRPTAIIHEKGHASGTASYRTIETIDYTFFTSN